ncbi:MAG: gamma-glutamylcyclotransferase, partial [Gammaproteobacteria bacterium]|nr:gamma-glutamylcyclotransferase [Gammaproteobacteria bacterium]
RRFWQGSHDHRGTPAAPGRVVTLIQEAAATCEGIAYAITHDVFDHLDHREKNGYVRLDVSLEFAHGLEPAVAYIAKPDNFAFLGSAPLADIARQIITSHGPSGSNLDYLLQLARALREIDAVDHHVFELEALTKDLAPTHGHPLLR